MRLKVFSEERGFGRKQAELRNSPLEPGPGGPPHCSVASGGPTSVWFGCSFLPKRKPTPRDLPAIKEVLKLNRSSQGLPTGAGQGLQCV